MTGLQELIAQYGYWLMALGAIIEGESFLIAGGIAAKHGLLSIPWIIVLAVVGSTLHDCTLFFTGRYAGGWVLKKKPNMRAHVERVTALLERYGVGVILFMRFAYGLRPIIPTALGLSHIPNKKFIIFDIIGGILWSFTFVFAGYLFGEALDMILKRLSDHHDLVVYILIAIGVIVMLGFLIWLKRRRSNTI